jgi:hypothetical protein
MVRSPAVYGFQEIGSSWRGQEEMPSDHSRSDIERAYVCLLGNIVHTMHVAVESLGLMRRGLSDIVAPWVAL